jgi:hypothetical protein
MRAHIVLMMLMSLLTQSCIVATITIQDTQENLTTDVRQTIVDSCDDADGIDLFTPDELVHQEEVIKEQEAKLSFYDVVIAKLQQIGGKISSPFFWLLYKFYKWRAQRA